MKKTNLKAGMLVQRRDNSWGIVIMGSFDGNRIISINGRTSDGLSSYDEDLRSNDDGILDIIKVARLSNTTQTISMIYDHKIPEDSCGYSILWQEEDARKKVITDKIASIHEEIDGHNAMLTKLFGDIDILNENLHWICEKEQRRNYIGKTQER